MDFRSAGTRFQLVRSVFDKVMNTRRTQVVGHISRQSLAVQASAGFTLTDAEQAACDRHVEQLRAAERLRDELALLTLPEAVERAARHLDLIEDAAARRAAARSMMFAAEELRRRARKATDITELDLVTE
jgi:predicted metal-dependent HD superfamily phosphohydrolase